MANLRLVGDVATDEAVTATVTYLTDYRDPDGRLPPPVLLFRRAAGGAWTAYPSGGLALVLGPDAPGQPVPRVRVTYVVLRSGLPPFARTVERRVLPNTDVPGFWDFTRPDAEQPAWSGGGGVVTPLEVLPGQGERGERGPGLLRAAGPPGDGLGSPGDTYLDTLSWDLYGREGGAWGRLGNLRGAAGGVGPQGERGTNGKSFPAPLDSQEGFVPVADGTQPHGFSWRPWAGLGIRLRDLADVDMHGVQGGQVPAWDAEARRWRPVDVEAGGGGAGTDPGDGTDPGGGPDPVPGAGRFTVATDSEGYQTITNADATQDADGYQTIADATATADPDGYESVERSTP